MGFHWGGGPTQINQVVAVTGPGPTPTTSASTTAKVEKKAPKAPIKADPSKGTAGTPSKRVVSFELIFTSRITGAQLTVRVPAVGAFHDPKRPTTLRDVKVLGKNIAEALNMGLHDVDIEKPKK